MTAALVAVLALGLAACTSSGAEPDDEGKKSKDPHAGKPLEVSFDTPEGFSKTKDFELAKPLTKDYEAKFLKLDASKTNELIFVASYVLDKDTSDMNTEELNGLVTEFDKTLGNTQKSAPYPAVANGHKGIHKYVYEPFGQKKLIYDAEYFFETDHVVMVGCQREKDKYIKDIYAGCQTVLENLEF